MGHAIAVALFLHLLGVAVWVGGMIFAHFCLRPALEDLSPQLRLPLIESVFGRFFNWVWQLLPKKDCDRAKSKKQRQG